MQRLIRNLGFRKAGPIPVGLRDHHTRTRKPRLLGQLAGAIGIGVGGGSLTRMLGFADRPMDALGTPTKILENGSRSWSRTTIADFKGLRPAFRRSGIIFGLRGWLRSSGLLIPSQADFQAFLHADGFGDLARIRTPTLQIRNLVLYPV